MTDAFDRAADRVESQRRERDREESRSRGGRIQRTAFQIHATAFVAVQILIVTIWAIVWPMGGGTAHPWLLYPLLGWGIGLAVHYAAVRDSWRPSSTTGAQHQ